MVTLINYQGMFGGAVAFSANKYIWYNLMTLKVDTNTPQPKIRPAPVQPVLRQAQGSESGDATPKKPAG